MSNKKHISDDWLIKQNMRIAESLAKMFDPFLEAVVHDYRRKNQGIVAIFGGQITGRKVGDPLTELGKYRVRGRPVADDLVGYMSESASGKPLKSTSLAIRNEVGEIVGALCLNVDLSILGEFQKQLLTFVSPLTELQVPKVERYRSRTATGEVLAAINSEIRERGLVLKQLNQTDREVIVESLAKQGLFSRRGAVTTIAKALNITRQSVYRYLKAY